jgi:uncharacterized protein (TIGR03435 family)
MAVRAVLAWMITIGFLNAPHSRAQQQTAPNLSVEFEAASIKASPAPIARRIRVAFNGGPGTDDPTLFTCQNYSLSMLLMQEYEVQYYQISGLSARSVELFNITARVSAGASREQFRLMLQHLLADRFKLVIHREFKDMQMYDLLVAKNGPKLEESPKDAVPPKGESQPTSPVPDAAVDKDGFPLLPPDCRGMVVIEGRVRMRGVQESMEEFAAWLSNRLDRPVTDLTGLKGKYDFSLYWMIPETERTALPLTADPGLGASAGAGDSGPSLFSAIQSQLGLRLAPTKGPVSIIVVDHVEKVSGN